MIKRGVRRFVEDLLNQRRPRPFTAQADDEAELRTAIDLRAAGPDSGPSEAFVAALQQRLRTELDPAAAAPAGVPQIGSRRRFLITVAAASAASAVAGVGLERGLAPENSPNQLSADQAGQAGQANQNSQTLTPDNGEWRPVIAAADLPEGGVQPFDLGTMVGFVHRDGGELRAVSGVCTHLYCKLALDAPERQLRCPCHSAAFGLDGQVLHHRLPIDLPPLPHLIVRESGGVVQIFAPAKPV